MNEFSIEWVKGGEYAGVTAPSGTALKSKLLKLAREHPNDVKSYREMRMVLYLHIFRSIMSK